MSIKTEYLFIFLFLLLIFDARSQIDSKRENNNENFNLVKKVWFKTKETIYPLTIVLSPFGYWYASDIYLGHNANNINEYLTHNTFGWGINKSKDKTSGRYSFEQQVETPRRYVYDTIVADTIFSIFKDIMCTNFNMKLPKYFNEKKELIKISDSSIYANIAKEFKYTYLMRNIKVTKDSCEVIKFIYPLNVYYPYKTSFAIVDLKIWGDKIEMISNSLNTVNLLDIKLERHGKVILKNKDYRRLIKRLSKTTFNTKIDCKVCNYQYYKDFDFVIMHENIENSNSYFLCENMHFVKSKEKDQKITIDYLSGLYYFICQLNKDYFGITRRNK